MSRKRRPKKAPHTNAPPPATPARTEGAPASANSEEPGEAPRWMPRAVAGVLLLAFVLRLVYVLQIQDSPLFDRPVMDPAYHLQWAASLARGESFQPGQAFFRAPLYPWFLAVWVWLGGPGLLLPRIVQALLGTATTGLVFLVGRRAFGAVTGLVAAFLAATYWVLIYYDGELLIPTLAVPLNLGALLLTQRLAAAPTRGRAVLAGAAWGLSALARPNVLVLLPVLAGWLLVRFRKDRAREGRLAAALLLVGAALPILPITAYNRAIGGDWVLISSQGGVNFFIGNNPASDGSTAVVPGTRQDWWGGYYDTIALAEQAEGRELKPSEVSQHYFARGREYLFGQPLDALQLWSFKLRLLVLDWELGNNQSIRFFAHHFGPVVRWLPLRFSWLFALTLVGLLGALRGAPCERRAARLPLLFFLGVYAFTIVAFFVCARFRVPLLPVAMVFAARGLVELGAALRRRDFAHVLPRLALLVLAVVVSVLPPGEGRGWFRRGRVDMTDASGYAQLGSFYAAGGDPERARELLLRATAERPKDLYAWRTLGDVQTRLGRLTEAAESLRTALDLSPRDATTLEHLVELHLKRRDHAAAEAAARALIQAAPADPSGHYFLARTWLERGAAGDPERAEEELLRGLALRPHFASYYALATISQARGQAPQALLYLRQAIEAPDGPATPEYYRQAAQALLQHYRATGQQDEARAVEHLLRRALGRP